MLFERRGVVYPENWSFQGSSVQKHFAHTSGENHMRSSHGRADKAS